VIHTVIVIDVAQDFVNFHPDDWEDVLRKSIQQCLGWRIIVRELEIKGVDTEVPSPDKKLVK